MAGNFFQFYWSKRSKAVQVGAPGAAETIVTPGATSATSVAPQFLTYGAEGLQGLLHLPATPLEIRLGNYAKWNAVIQLSQ